MPRKLQLTGLTFAKWYVESYAGVRNGNTMWNCVCACGNQKVVFGTNLTSGKSTSCGSCVLREVEIVDDIVKIPLTQSQFAIVDLVDYEAIELLHANWFAHWNKDTRSYYAVKKLNGTMVYIHRVIMNPPFNLFVDHWSHDTLDNRRCNLRICTNSQNNQNQLTQRRKKSSKYKGVCWFKRSGKWKAQIGFEGKLIHLGFFDSEEEAALAYNSAAIELHRGFKCLNDL